MSNPFSDSSNIQIRLIRSTELDNEKADDRICIVYSGEDSFTLYYKDANATRNLTHLCNFTGDDLDTYLRNLFFLLTRDRDPFRSIQFNIPCCPTILLLMDDLRKKGVKEALNEILPLMSSCLKIRI